MYDLIILGAGSAGLSAAIFAARRKLKVLVLSKDLGGQLRVSTKVENYPGIEQISGPELMSKFEHQAKKFGAKIIYEEVTKIKKENKTFSVKTKTDNYSSKSLILAFGKTPIDLGVANEEKFKGKGVYYCANCDLPLFKNKTIVVVGDGNNATDTAILATKFSNKVFLIYENKNWNKLFNSKLKNIKLINGKIIEISGSKFLEFAKIQNNKKIETLKLDAIFVEKGWSIKRNLIKNLVRTNSKSQVPINENCSTSVPGLFAAGGITNTGLEQIVISAGQGATAALQAYKYLLGKETVGADWDF